MNFIRNLRLHFDYIGNKNIKIEYRKYFTKYGVNKYNFEKDEKLLEINDKKYMKTVIENKMGYNQNQLNYLIKKPEQLLYASPFITTVLITAPSAIAMSKIIVSNFGILLHPYPLIVPEMYVILLGFPLIFLVASFLGIKFITAAISYKPIIKEINGMRLYLNKYEKDALQI